jgi:arsenate reductase-like glutaredoxin family protein
MGIMAKHDNMNKIYYSSKSSIGKKTLAYLKASYKDLLDIDINKTKVTGTQWKELAENLDIKISDFVDKNPFNFTAYKDADADLSETDWIKVLNNNPEVLTHPIVILGKDFYQIHNPSEIEKLLKPNSKGIDEKKSI